jgi:hypothetical protein
VAAPAQDGEEAARVRWRWIEKKTTEKKIGMYD